MHDDPQQRGFISSHRRAMMKKITTGDSAVPFHISLARVDGRTLLPSMYHPWTIQAAANGSNTVAAGASATSRHVSTSPDVRLRLVPSLGILLHSTCPTPKPKLPFHFQDESVLAGAAH